MTALDARFEFWFDTPEGMDPDRHSPTLRRCHKILWSKPLPCGATLDLNGGDSWELRHKSECCELFLSSDSIGHTYSRGGWTKHGNAKAERMPRIIEGISKDSTDETDEFLSVCSTIGAYILFPSRQIDGKWTINQARGCHPKIKDRFDLTLECIRRFYFNEEGANPLRKALQRHAPFFLCFKDFRGYVDFFLLQDLVAEEYSAVKFFLPFDGFKRSPLPGDIREYLQYKDALTAFVNERNQRMLNSVRRRTACGAEKPCGRGRYLELTDFLWEQAIARLKSGGNPDATMDVLKLFYGSQKVKWEGRGREAVSPIVEAARKSTGNADAEFCFWVEEESSWAIGFRQRRNLRKALKAAGDA